MSASGNTDWEPTDVQIRPVASRRKAEILLLAVVLVAAHHAITSWIFWEVLPGRRLYYRLSQDACSNIRMALSGIMPLLLCLGAPTRSGLVLGTWRPRTWLVVCVCAIPVALVAFLNPFTSQPFADAPIGAWLISPAAQDLLFSGYLYGLLSTVFPGRLSPRLPLDKPALLTAAFFSLWHTPNFFYIGAAFVTFQLFYTFLFCVWILIARKWTGSILPVVASHMAANYFG